MTTFRKGDHLVICERTGRRVHRSQCVLQWDNLLVLRSHAEERHPQDLLPPGRATKPVDVARLEGVDKFLECTFCLW